jgi:hypothetical protein
MTELNPCRKCGAEPNLGFADDYGNDDHAHWGGGCCQTRLAYTHSKLRAVAIWNAANPIAEPDDLAKAQSRIKQLEEELRTWPSKRCATCNDRGYEEGRKDMRKELRKVAKGMVLDCSYDDYCIGWDGAIDNFLAKTKEMK